MMVTAAVEEYSSGAISRKKTFPSKRNETFKWARTNIFQTKNAEMIGSGEMYLKTWKLYTQAEWWVGVCVWASVCLSLDGCFLIHI